MTESTRKKYEQELRRLDAEIVDLEAHWEHIPRYMLFALLAPIVWYLHSLSAAVVELMVTAALLGTRSYLIGVRKSENRWTRASVARELG